MLFTSLIVRLNAGHKDAGQLSEISRKLTKLLSGPVRKPFRESCSVLYDDVLYFFGVGEKVAVERTITDAIPDTGEISFELLDHQNSVRRLFRLAVGLASETLGDTGWLAAFEKKVLRSDEENEVGVVLLRLYRELKKTAKISRAHTNIASGPSDRYEAIAELAEKIFGELTDARALILAARDDELRVGIPPLLAKGLERSNLSLMSDVTPENLSDAIKKSDIVISTIGNCLSMLEEEDTVPDHRDGNRTPMLIVDLTDTSSPPEHFRSASGLYFYSTAPLDGLIDRTMANRIKAVKDVEKLLEEQIESFTAWLESDKWDVSRSIVARSHTMQELFRIIDKVSPTNTTVLITGETGTGKELVACAIHQSSPRADKPFIAVNCGAIPETLLESTLFGHLRGSFTGATEDRAGMFRAAEGGTLFLDEVSEIPIQLQVKLLRALQDREVQPVGAEKPQKVDVRLIAASNTDLKRAVDEAKFRQDLYYRLDVVDLKLPPLRERLEDVIPLAEHFLEKQRETTGNKELRFTQEARDALVRYQWPGNVRQLENAIEHAAILAVSDWITPADFPSHLTKEPASVPAKQAVFTLEEMEKEHILSVLDDCRNNYSLAAEALGIGRTTLWRKMKKYNITEKNTI